MNKRVRLEPIAVAAESRQAIVATLVARLDAVLESWQRTIPLEGKASAKIDNVKPRPPAEVLFELQGQINHLDLLIDVLQREVNDDTTQTRAWDQRANRARRSARVVLECGRGGGSVVGALNSKRVARTVKCVRTAPETS